MDGSAVVASAWEYASRVEVGFVDTDGVERSSHAVRTMTGLT
ncbi:hypothetical protein ACWGHU_10410 [Streptomyces xanthophaeus]